MAILRAGPWGNLTDSFQSVPSNTAVPLTEYPVNVAKGNWPNQTWAAWYELTVAGCCNPAQIEVTFPYTTDFGYTIQYHTVTINRGTFGECGYGYAENPASYYRGKVFETVWNGTAWQTWFGNEDFSQADDVHLDSLDECDPTGVTTISGTYYYNGETITITDPNA